MITYVDVLSKYYPALTFSAIGDGSIYENITIVSGGSLPPQQDLDVYILEETRNAKWEEIKNERDRRKLDGGYKVNVNGTDYWFHSDTTSRIQQIALVMMGANLPANLNWKTMSGAFVVMTQTLAMQVFMAAASSDAVLFAVTEQKRQAVLSSQDPASYNVTTGWPLIYGE